MTRRAPSAAMNGDAHTAGRRAPTPGVSFGNAAPGGRTNGRDARYSRRDAGGDGVVVVGVSVVVFVRRRRRVTVVVGFVRNERGFRGRERHRADGDTRGAGRAPPRARPPRAVRSNASLDPVPFGGSPSTATTATSRVSSNARVSSASAAAGVSAEAPGPVESRDDACSAAATGPGAASAFAPAAGSRRDTAGRTLPRRRSTGASVASRASPARAASSSSWSARMNFTAAPPARRSATRAKTIAAFVDGTAGGCAGLNAALALLTDPPPVTVERRFFSENTRVPPPTGAAACWCGRTTAGRTADASRTQRRHGAGVSRRPSMANAATMPTVSVPSPRLGRGPGSAPSPDPDVPFLDRARAAHFAEITEGLRVSRASRDATVSLCARNAPRRRADRRRARGAGSRPPVRRANLASRGAPIADDAGCAFGEVGRARVRRGPALRRRRAGVVERARLATAKEDATRTVAAAQPAIAEARRARARARARRAGDEAGGVQAEAEGGPVRVRRRGTRRRAQDRARRARARPRARARTRPANGPRKQEGREEGTPSTHDSFGVTRGARGDGTA